MTQQQIVIQNSSRELQVAVVEDGRLADYLCSGVMTAL